MVMGGVGCTEAVQCRPTGFLQTLFLCSYVLMKVTTCFSCLSDHGWVAGSSEVKQ